jgi:hypothetical protein
VNVHLVVIEQRDQFDMRARDEVENVGTRSAKSNNGDLLSAQQG